MSKSLVLVCENLMLVCEILTLVWENLCFPTLNSEFASSIACCDYGERVFEEFSASLEVFASLRMSSVRSVVWYSTYSHGKKYSIFIN